MGRPYPQRSEKPPRKRAAYQGMIRRASSGGKKTPGPRDGIIGRPCGPAVSLPGAVGRLPRPPSSTGPDVPLDWRSRDDRSRPAEDSGRGWKEAEGATEPGEEEVDFRFASGRRAAGRFGTRQPRRHVGRGHRTLLVCLAGSAPRARLSATVTWEEKPSEILGFGRRGPGRKRHWNRPRQFEALTKGNRRYTREDPIRVSPSGKVLADERGVTVFASLMRGFRRTLSILLDWSSTIQRLKAREP